MKERCKCKGSHSGRMEADDAPRRSSPPPSETEASSNKMAAGEGDVGENEAADAPQLMGSEHGASKGEAEAEGVGGERDKRDLLHEADRLVTFTDAVVAIAMTLLILPLMESATAMGEVSEAEEEAESGSASDWFAEHGRNLGALGISFFTIFLLWIAHDRLFRYVGFFSMTLLKLNFLWLAGVVFYPVAAALLVGFYDQVANATYMGTGLATALIKLVMTLVVRRDERTWKVEGRRPGMLVVALDVILVCIFALALLISQLAPKTGAYPLLLLLLNGPIFRLVKWRKPDWTR